MRDKLQEVIIVWALALINIVVCAWTMQSNIEFDRRLTQIEKRTASVKTDTVLRGDGFKQMLEPCSFRDYTAVPDEPDAAAPPTDVPYWPLTESERNTICRIAMGEARGEPYEGQMMVAQAILDGWRREGGDLKNYLWVYHVYVTWDGEVSNGVAQAVSAVFDDGQRVTEEKADLWYAYKTTKSPWHEKQKYITTIGNHKFFWCAGEVSR